MTLVFAQEFSQLFFWHRIHPARRNVHSIYETIVKVSLMRKLCARASCDLTEKQSFPQPTERKMRANMQTPWWTEIIQVNVYNIHLKLKPLIRVYIYRFLYYFLVHHLASALAHSKCSIIYAPISNWGDSTARTRNLHVWTLGGALTSRQSIKLNVPDRARKKGIKEHATRRLLSVYRLVHILFCWCKSLAHKDVRCVITSSPNFSCARTKSKTNA